MLAPTPPCHSHALGQVKHIILFANRDINDGEELSFDYQLSIDGEAIECYCGAPNCLGRMA